MVKIRQWVARGALLVNADALDPGDPDSTYEQIAAQGEDPEKYGVPHPATEMYETLTRSELCKLVWELQREIEALHSEMAR